MNADKLKEKLQFGAIFHMNYVFNFGIAMQLSTDILASKDGFITGERRKPGDP
jgi:hypothetical protein